MAFSRRPSIASAQERTGYFFVTPIASDRNDVSQLSTTDSLTVFQEWITRRGITSPRTGAGLYVNGRRFRHTVATHLVKKGWAADEISEFLEHSAGRTVLAYMDAVGNDLSPHLERVDIVLGGLFSDMTKNYQGKVIDRPTHPVEKPIAVPDGTNTSIIGQCGLSTQCMRNPFSACLSGCPNFLLFSDADTNAAQTWINETHSKWRGSERSEDKDRVIEDFARMAHGLQQAITWQAK